MVKERTTINLDVDLLIDVRESGVRNLSRHVEKLLRQELRGEEKIGHSQEARVDTLSAELLKVEREWFAYVKRSSGRLVAVQVQ